MIWLVILIKSWIFLSQTIVFIWLFRLGEPRWLSPSKQSFFDRFDWIHSGGLKEKLGIAIVISAIIGLWYIAYEGFRDLLQFIPNSWGSHDEEGGWHSLRNDVSALFAAIVLPFVCKALSTEHARLKSRRAQYEREQADKQR